MNVEELSKIFNYLLESGKGHYKVFDSVYNECSDQMMIASLLTDVEVDDEEEGVLLW